MDEDVALVPPERIERSILLIRGQKVLLSTDLAELYQVEPRALVQAVKRNIARFPQDFMFQLTAEEFSDLKSQIVISSWGGRRRARPYAFIEQGVAMLSSGEEVRGQVSTFNKLSFSERNYLHLLRGTGICRYGLKRTEGTLVQKRLVNFTSDGEMR
jgi:hypothetical protein